MSILKNFNLVKAVVNYAFACAKEINDGYLLKYQKFLVPNNVSVTPSCGLKIKGIIRKRCTDCYFVRREGKMYVMCRTFPRHKQMLMAPREKRTWILSHACQSKFRPY